MGDIIPPRNYTTVERKILEVNNKQVKLTVYKGDTIDTIFIGGHTKFCIDAVVQKADTEFAKRGGNVSNAFVSKVYYDINCSLDGKLRGSLDTNIIICLLISFLKNNYSHLKTVTFKDTRTRECGNHQYVNLAEISYVRTGKTWYETHFHAYVDPLYESNLKQCHTKFTDTKKIITWEHMNEYMSGPLPIDELEMKQFFEEATTWQDFFGPLSDQITIPQFCELVAPWLHTFLNLHFGFSLCSVNYVIPLTSFNPIQYTTIDSIRGGRRLTQKKRKQRPTNEM